MKRTLARWLLHAYPRPWRERYGSEFLELLNTCHGRADTVIDVLWAALRERCVPTVKSAPVQLVGPGSIRALWARPSGFVPMVLSLAALALLTGRLVTVGIARHGDEGAFAHLWQLLMAGQLPAIAWFALRGLHVAPRAARVVLSIQIALFLAAVAPVYFLGL